MSGIPAVPPCDTGMYIFLQQIKAALDGSTGAKLYPKPTAVPTAKGEVTVEITDNRTLTFSLKGTDGTVRSGTITLS